MRPGPAACDSSAPARVETIQSFPIASLDGVLTRSGVAFDADTSSDGNGSLRVTVEEGASTIRLETGDLDVDQNPTNIRLNLVIEGPGTVWIDEVGLTAAS